jgi:hypothetical protein
MNILKITTFKIVLLVFTFVVAFNNFVFAETNPSREQIESIIDEVATERAIPSVLLKSIARVESVYKQFNEDGTPLVEGTCIGLMMVNNRYGGYDSNLLKYDLRYNIEAGADVLLNKWSMSSYKMVSSVGNMDPNVLENWYFALWAYNGWAESNNPHMLPAYVKKYTYQQLIYDVCNKEYNQKINNIDFAYLPASGKPSRSLVVPTPSYVSSGDIVLYEKGDYVVTDGIRSCYNLRDVPGGKYIYELPEGQLGTIVDGPILEDGYYWYKVYINDDMQGWIERNWLLRTGDDEHGKYVFDDIAFDWSRKNIMELYSEGIVSEATSYEPEDATTREEFCVLLDKTLKVKGFEENQNDSSVSLLDAGEISPWALDYVDSINQRGLLQYFNGELEPTESMTRLDAALILSDVFEEDEQFTSLDISQIYSDLDSLSQEQINAVKKTYTAGLMSGKSTQCFAPYEYLSRGEAAAVMAKVLDKQ